MRFASGLRAARRRAGLSQRQLAERAGVPQSTIGRIEAGLTDPRVSTLQALLRACGDDLEALPLLGVGIDVTLIEAQLAKTPAERLEDAVRGARTLEVLERARVRAKERRSP